MVHITSSPQSPSVTWEPLPADFVLPDDPVENIQQPLLAAALTDALDANRRIQPAMLIGSNFGLVATVNQKIVVKAPDWFYVPQVQPTIEGTIRRSYTPHIQGAEIAVVMEFLSDEDNGELSIRDTPPYGKFYFYEQILQVPTYAVFNPYDASLRVWHLQSGRYQLQAADESGRVWVPELELFLGVWIGERQQQTLAWLHWWDRSGNLLLWSAEKAEQEGFRAEQERLRAEGEYQRAEQERLRAEKLAAKLRELGIDPEE